MFQQCFASQIFNSVQLAPIMRSTSEKPYTNNTLPWSPTKRREEATENRKALAEIFEIRIVSKKKKKNVIRLQY